MKLNIDKKEMDQAWVERDTSPKFYKYLYDIASLQVSRKGIRYEEQEDYIQFALMKCHAHKESYRLEKGASYSFFWKQISLAIIYKQRKQARHNNKVKTFYVEQEKVLDWAEQQWHEEGELFSSIVDRSEALMLRKAYKKYNSQHIDNKAEHTKQGAIKVLKWMEEKEPGFIENNFTTLKPIFKNWLNFVEAKV
jgi:DNA-directed RNA polymerase specialized sigma24 family protein